MQSPLTDDEVANVARPIETAIGLPNRGLYRRGVPRRRTGADSRKEVDRGRLRARRARAGRPVSRHRGGPAAAGGAGH